MQRKKQPTSALISAAQSNDVDGVKKILQSLPDNTVDQKKIIDEKDSNQFTALHHAVRNANVDILNLLLNYGAAVNSQGGPFAETPLHMVAKLNQVDTEIVKEMVKKLLNAGILWKMRNSKSEMAVHIAARYRSAGVMEELLKHDQSNVSERGAGSCTPLVCAAYVKNNAAVVQLLLNNGADPYEQGNIYRKSAFDIATTNPNKDQQLINLLQNPKEKPTLASPGATP
jgi:ankyrin repeat protein